MDYGIDISNFQGGTITWSAVKQDGISFASILQTDTNGDGSPFVNPYANTQVLGARAVGITCGGYHFARPGVSISQQVDRFVGQLEANHLLDTGCLQPTLDMEVLDPHSNPLVSTPPDEFVAEFKHRFTAATGTGLIVYANLTWWNTLLHPDQWADDRTWLWLALYNGQPADTGGWTHPRLAIHQSTSHGAVPGFMGFVDRDETINGFSLANLTIGAADMTVDELLDTVLTRKGSKFDGTPQQGNTSLRAIGEWTDAGWVQSAVLLKPILDEILAAIATVQASVTDLQNRPAGPTVNLTDQDRADIVRRLLASEGKALSTAEVQP